MLVKTFCPKKFNKLILLNFAVNFLSVVYIWIFIIYKYILKKITRAHFKQEFHVHKRNIQLCKHLLESIFIYSDENFKM